MWETFIQNYALDTQEAEMLKKMYELEEIMSFLPKEPTPSQQNTFKKLLGTETESGYLDYQKSNNTFELIMQWREIEGIFE